MTLLLFIIIWAWLANDGSSGPDYDDEPIDLWWWDL